MSGKVRYIKVARIDGNGTDITNTLESLTNIILPLTGGNRTYQILNRTRFNDYYLYYVNPPDLADIPGADKSTLEYNFTSSLTSSISTTPGAAPYVIDLLTTLGTPSNVETITKNIDFGPNDNRKVTQINTYPQKTIAVRISGSSTGLGTSGNSPLNVYVGNDSIANIATLSNTGTTNFDSTISIPISSQSPSMNILPVVTVFGGNSVGFTFSSGTTMFITSSVATGTEKEVIVEPYLTMKFKGSDCEVLQGEATGLRANPFLQDLDYSTSQTVPVNLQAIISESATKGTVPESNYTQLANANPRYYGSKNQTEKLNEWTQFKGNTGTYGKTSAIDSETSLIVYCDWIGGNKPERNDTVSAHIQYIIKEDGTIEEPNLKPESVGNIQYAFESRKNAVVNLTDPPAGGGMQTLNGKKQIVRGGYRIEPVLYTQSGSLPDIHFTSSLEFRTVENETSPNDVRALFEFTSSTQEIPDINVGQSAEKMLFHQSVYGGSFLSNSTYLVDADVVENACSLIFSPQILIRTAFFLSVDATNPNAGSADISIELFRNRGGNETLIGAFKTPSQFKSISNPNLITINNIGTYYNDQSNPGGDANADFIIGTTQETYFGSLAPSPYGSTLKPTIPITPIIVPPGEIQNNDEFFIKIAYYNTAISLAVYDLFIQDEADFFTTANLSQTTTFKTALNVDQDPAFISSVSSPFWAYSGSGLTHITSSEALGKSYGIYRQLDIPNSGFSNVTLPFTLQTGDEFRFKGSENYVFPVKSVIEPQNNNAIIKVEFYEALPSGSGFDLNEFSIRRYVEDGSFIIFEAEKPAGNSGPSIIKPEFTTVNLERDINEIIVDLTDRGLIE